MNKNFRNIVLIWLLWAVVVIGFQYYGTSRMQPKRPDTAVEWSASETTLRSQDDKPYIIDPFMNNQVAWDSEFYIGVAIAGYNDPSVRVSPPTAMMGHPLQLSYAFLPLYPYTMRLVAAPMRLFGMQPIPAATLAGVSVALLGTLLAMFALYDIAKSDLGEDGALRAACYLLIFPSSFFLAQVYSEGLFLGLTFATLALVRRKNWLLAGICAALTTLTRAYGALIIIPLAWWWWQDKAWQGFGQSTTRLSALGKSLSVAAPVITFLAWKFSPWGQAFSIVEETFFQRGLLEIGRSMFAWKAAFGQMISGEDSVRSVYFALEFLAIVFSLAACFLSLKRYPELALFGLAVTLVSLFSGASQGMHRYVLAVPVIFLVLARWGKNVVFDRTWSLASGAVMMFNAVLFAYNYWVG